MEDKINEKKVTTVNEIKIHMEGRVMDYYVEIKKVGIKTYSCTFNQMLAQLALECISIKRTISANVMDSDHNRYRVDCRYSRKCMERVEVYVKEL